MAQIWPIYLRNFIALNLPSLSNIRSFGNQLLGTETGTKVEETVWHVWSVVLCGEYGGGNLQTLPRTQMWPSWAKVTLA